MSDIKGVEVTDVFGASKPITKLIEVVSAGMGKLYDPIHIKRMAKAKVAEINLMSEAFKENINLPMKYSSGEITIDALEAKELMQRTGERLIFQEMQKQQNIESIIEIARDELEKEQSVSQEPVDMDWSLRFFNSIGDISNESLQAIWGRILAGEIKSPQRYSVRTLDKLKNINQQEAELFSKVINYVFEYKKNYFIPTGLAHAMGGELNLKKHDLYFAKFHALDECGFVSSTGLSLPISFCVDNNSHVLSSDHVYTLKSTSGSDFITSLAVYALTRAGIELFTILEPKTNTEFEDEFMTLLKASGNIIIKHDIYSRNPDGTVQYQLDGVEVPIAEVKENSL